ncbi:MAG: nucleotidyltransferase domain-containing protein [Magnetococcales bacterium]|nr:nucleotidyltransferase domain-containing protein [Magnetococcales bacterium]
MAITEDVLNTMVRFIVEAAQPEKIILFGSAARGEDHPDSDVDLLVIESEPFGPARSRYQEIARLERAMGTIPLATDILVYSNEEVERLKSSTNHVVARALREGRVLHELNP